MENDNAVPEGFTLGRIAFNNSYGDGPDGETFDEAVERERKAEERFERATQAAHRAIAAQPTENAAVQQKDN